MNDLTRRIVKETALENKAMAKRNDSDFRWQVVNNHWNYLIDHYGVDLKKRAMHLLSLFRPEFFDQDGYIHEFADMVFDLDRRLSWLAVRLVERHHQRSCVDTGDGREGTSLAQGKPGSQFAVR